MQRVALIAILTAAALLSGCMPTPQPVKGPVEPTAAELRNVEQARELMLPGDADAVSFNRNRSACEALSGSFRPDGRLGASHCVITYSDGGKPCSDDADCKGDCRGKVEPAAASEAAAKAPGLCQQTTSRFGCYSTIRNGRAEGTICVD